MKKRILTVLLAVCLVVALGTITAAAADEDEGTPVARIGDTTYTSLYDVMLYRFKPNETLVLLADCSTSWFSLPANSTIDLNGFDLTYTGKTTITLTGKGNITDNSISGGGTLIINGARDAAQSVFEIIGTKLNVSNINIESTGCVFYPRNSGAELNISNCDIITSGIFCVSTNAEYKEHYGVTINIVGSSLTADALNKDDCAVMMNVSGSLNIEDSVITGNRQGVFARAGDVNIVNSEIIVTGAWAELEGNDADKYYDSENWKSGNEAPSAAIVIGNRNGTYFADADVTIDNSKITSNSETLSAIYVDATTGPQGESTEKFTSNVSITGSETVVTGSVTSKDADDKTIEIEVTGGSFTDTSVKKYIPDGMELNDEDKVVVSSNAVAVINGVGYTSLATAIESAANGDTITLVNDVTTDATVTIPGNKNLTIVGNGNSIVINHNASSGETQKALSLSSNLTLNDVTLTINGHPGDNGTHIGDGIEIYDAELAIVNGSKVTLDGVKNAMVMPGGADAKVTVKDSEFTLNDIGGNGSNGGTYVFNNADINVDGCDSYGFSVYSMTTSGNTTIDISNTSFSAIYGHTKLDFGGNTVVNVSNCGKGMPSGAAAMGLQGCAHSATPWPGWCRTYKHRPERSDKYYWLH